MNRSLNAPLSPHSTLGVGGCARELWTVTQDADIVDALRIEPNAFILGGGSNVVFSDAPYPGIVLHMATRGMHVSDLGDSLLYDVAAGEPWEDFVARTLADGCQGLECLSGIPGTVGATPIQNVGAYGREVSEFIRDVVVIDRVTGKQRVVANEACGFSYRMSDFKRTPSSVVTRVRFVLRRSTLSLPLLYKELANAMGASTALASRVRDTVIALRRNKGMVLDARDPESRSVGSFFMNPTVDAATADAVAARVPGVQMPRYPAADDRVKLAAGWLVERAGCSKGEALGGARISRKHALALVNDGTATAADITALARSIRDRVHTAFGVTLEPEPVFVGHKL